MTRRMDAIAAGDFSSDHVYRNLTPARLTEHALAYDDCRLAATGAVAACSGEKTGRSPKDKRIVIDDVTRDEIWWGPVNSSIKRENHVRCRQRAIEFLERCDRIYVVDGFAGWDPRYQIKVRVICSRPYHALFMHNMLIRPTPDQLAEFGQPDYTIYNAGRQSADLSLDEITSDTSITLDLTEQEIVILGSEYAGEMKKGVFSVMNYIMPKQNVLSMHCSANESQSGDVSLFFGLSGTGKTTLSADPRRKLIGDDEHCWTDHGVFNIEGGCYAKCIGLSAAREPQIFAAIRFGSILENTVLDPTSCEVDYDDGSLTQNTRVSYPIDYIPNAKIPCLGGHPNNIIFLTCDAFGILPPVSRLTPEQTMYHFVSGYTAKVAGTEQGVTEPEATFSACFGAAFLPLSPIRYAELLAQRMRSHEARAWLINTGWTGGGYGVGQRIELSHTRAIIDAIHTGTINESPFSVDPVFGVEVPEVCAGCPASILKPAQTWSSSADYLRAAQDLSRRFQHNFASYADDASEGTRSAGPKVPERISVGE